MKLNTVRKVCRGLRQCYFVQHMFRYSLRDEMPFCRECAFEVQATWKFCPNCNSSQPQSDEVSSFQNVSVNLNDSVIAGDVNITQNSVEEMKIAMKELFDQKIEDLRKIGFDEDHSPTLLTLNQKIEVEKILEASNHLSQQGVNIDDPLVECQLGNAAFSINNYLLAKHHYYRSLELYEKQGREEWQTSLISKLATIARILGDEEELRLLRERIKNPIVRGLFDMGF